MASLALNTVYNIFSTIFCGWKSKDYKNYSVEKRLKTKEDILFFDKTIHEMRKNNEKEKEITLPSDQSKLKIRLK